MEVLTNDQGFVVSEFSIGDQYKADFVVASAFSGGWEIHFIELEPPSLSPFNKKGELSSRLVHAAGQIRHWKDFESRHDKIDWCGANIIWPESMLLMEYHVIMARRSHLS